MSASATTTGSSKKSIKDHIRDGAPKALWLIVLFLVWSYAWPRISEYYQPAALVGIRANDKQADAMLVEHTQNVVDPKFAEILADVKDNGKTTADYVDGFRRNIAVARDVNKVRTLNQLQKMAARGEDYYGGDPPNVVDVSKLELQQPFQQIGWVAGVGEFRIRDNDYRLVLPRMGNVCPPTGCTMHVPPTLARLPRLYRNRPYGAVVIQLGNGRDGASRSYSNWERVEEVNVNGETEVWWVIRTPETTRMPVHATINLPVIDDMNLRTGRYWDLLDDVVYRERRKFTVWIQSSAN